MVARNVYELPENSVMTHALTILDSPLAKSGYFPDEYIQNLSHIIFPYNAKERVMASFAAYFDESGTHGSPVLALACCIATVEQWVEFSREWDEVLKQEGLTHFHMSKFEARQGEFKGWDNARRLRVQKRLLGIIARRVNVGMFCAVNLAAYDEFVTDRWRANYGSPYHFCVKICLSFIAMWAQHYQRKEPLAYIIEQGAGYNNEINRQFCAVSANEKMRNFFRLGSLTFDDKKRALPLQAADLLTYEIWKDAVNNFVTDPDNKRPERKSLLYLREHILHQGSYWGRDEFMRQREMAKTNFEIRMPDGVFKFTFNPDDTSHYEIITPTVRIKFDE